MKPEYRSMQLLAMTRSKAKMYEFLVPERYHIEIRDPARLLTLAIGLLGDLAAAVNTGSEGYECEPAGLQDAQFAAHFFSAYFESQFGQNPQQYLLLLASSAYYLCNFPGSSSVVSGQLALDDLDLGGLGLERLLLWLLQGAREPYGHVPEHWFHDHISAVAEAYSRYRSVGDNWMAVNQRALALRGSAYSDGTPRQLLLADLVCAVIRKHYWNSTWYCLPRYTDLSRETWSPVLQGETFVHELWPGQRLLGDSDVFRGRSAVIQMPTSAGKTRAVEIVIRSAFLSGRTALAVIVAPFRALCHEIRDALVRAFHAEQVTINELSDVPQADFAAQVATQGQQVLVVTPEKLAYVLRQVPELSQRIGLVIYDEGHLFDSSGRGAAYELLATALKSMIPENAQTVLLSAVISNARAVGDWLNGPASRLALGTQLNPTFRSTAFASWPGASRRGQLQYFSDSTEGDPDFFVPRLLEKHVLTLRPRETVERVFPDTEDPSAIALYLGLKLVQNGPVAVFCGSKPNAWGVCDRALDAYERELAIPPPSSHSDRQELRRLIYQCERNFGEEAQVTRSTRLGILSHHGDVPGGVRLAAEHAMRQNLARMVICTSSLAQGVNLPIRYLIVSGIHQGTDRIRVRDFQNLMGRAGRSGLHTEGSIIFADPSIYDTRHTWNNGWRWRLVQELLDPQQAEPCGSVLGQVLSPLTTDDGRPESGVSGLTVARMYARHPEWLAQLPQMIAARDELASYSGLAEQIADKCRVFAAIESFIMSNCGGAGGPGLVEDACEIVTGTLAYHLADEEDRSSLVKLFRLLARNVEEGLPDLATRRVLSRTFSGVDDALRLAQWTHQHMDELAGCNTFFELLRLLWPVLSARVKSRSFQHCSDANVVQRVAESWIDGASFGDLLQILIGENVRFGTGRRPRKPHLHHVVEICENGLGYEGTLAVGAIADLLELEEAGNESSIRHLQHFQKCLKYGLPSATAIMLHELGFADRCLASDLLGVIGECGSGADALAAMSDMAPQVLEVLDQYPSYFLGVFEQL